MTSNIENINDTCINSNNYILLSGSKKNTENNNGSNSSNADYYTSSESDINDEKNNYKNSFFEKKSKTYYIKIDLIKKQFKSSKEVCENEDAGLKILNDNFKKDKLTLIILEDVDKKNKILNNGKKNYEEVEKNKIKLVNKEKLQEVFLNVDLLSIKDNLEIMSEIYKKYLETMKENLIKTNLEKFEKIKNNNLEIEKEKIKNEFYIKKKEELKNKFEDLKNFKNLLDPKFLNDVVETANFIGINVSVCIEKNSFEKIKKNILFQSNDEIFEKIKKNCNSINIC